MPLLFLADCVGLLFNPTATNSNSLLTAGELHSLKNDIAFSLRLCVSLLINPTATTTYNIA